MLRFFLPLLLLLLLCTCDRAQNGKGGKEEGIKEERDKEGKEEGSKGGLPNILFILTDDQGIGDLSLHGNDSIRTPNMDRLLTEGARFTRFYRHP